MEHFVERILYICLLLIWNSAGYCSLKIVRGITSQQIQTNPEIIITDAIRRIKRDGYPVEEHTVRTKDGYILTIHRIPFQDAVSGSNLRKPVVLLLPGIYASSDAWLLNGRDDALPYLLSKNGFDVWLGNNRGNVYSKRHVHYKLSDRKFWNFSWHEMAVFDMPAMIDYIIEKTGESQMHFVGISQGGTIFLVLNSVLVQYNDIFKSATLLAPVSYVSHTKGTLARIFGPILGTRNYLTNYLEGVEIISTNKLIKMILSKNCLEHEQSIACAIKLWPAFGYNTRYLNKTVIPDLMANFPTGGSFKQIIHYFQGYVSGSFRMYDYGLRQNMIHYKRNEPPEYNLGNITAPVSVYYSENDYIVAIEDTWKLLLRLKNLKVAYKIPWNDWNHFDFICGVGVPIHGIITQVYNHFKDCSAS